MLTGYKLRLSLKESEFFSDRCRQRLIRLSGIKVKPYWAGESLNNLSWKILCFITPLYLNFYQLFNGLKRKMTNSIFIVTALILAFWSNFTFAYQSQNRQENLEYEIDKILSKQSYSVPGISLIIRKDNQVVINKSKGVANLLEDIPITSKTGFRIGSISKPFTAIAILQLYERGELSLTDSVNKYIKRLPSDWKTITIYQLLSHQVSLNKDFFSGEYIELANAATNQEVLDFIETKGVVSDALKPNQSVYCNTCYVLLAEVVKEVSGVSFSQYMQENIFSPAQMTDTYIITKGIQLRNGDALNYAKTDSFFGIKQYTTGAMAQVSSAEDLNSFVDSLKKFSLISAESLALMTRIHSRSNEGGFWGLGWMVGPEDRPFFAHGGSQDGYEAELYFNSKTNVELIFLSNGGEATFEIKRKILRATINYFEGE